MRRVVDELFCSSWGDDALLALGELALERGDYDAARRYWEQISPLLRAPDGEPLWLALRDIDLNANWPEIERRWQMRKNPPDWLAYPDTQLDLADVRARLILASIRAGQFDRAALELDVFRRLHPNAAGQLRRTGRAIRRSARTTLGVRPRMASPIRRSPDWPTFAGSQSRSPNAMAVGPTLVPVWERPIPLAPPSVRASTAQQQVRATADLASSAKSTKYQRLSVRESERPLSCFPVVVDDVVLFADATGNSRRRILPPASRRSLTDGRDLSQCDVRS